MPNTKKVKLGKHRGERLIGARSGSHPGPLLVVLGAIHGNEPAGLEAARRVLADLAPLADRLAGRIVAFAGNLAALRNDVRYLEDDLNRIWTEADLVALAGSLPHGDSPERREQRELLAAIEAELSAEGDSGAILIDLHTTSGDGPPFCLIGDTLQNRSIAFAYGVPVLLGLEETLAGTLLSYYSERGFRTVAIEGGQHTALDTVENHVAALWITLVAAGLLQRSDVAQIEQHEARLRTAAEGIPPVIEIFYRHPLSEGEEFLMCGDFENFQDVTAGTQLAMQGHEQRPVSAHETSILIMPRYQNSGCDGFFLGKPVRPFWLKFSARLRKLHLDRLLHALPGVRRSRTRAGELVVNAHVARLFTVQIFHLFGYRKVAEEGATFRFVRRVEARRS